MDNFTPAGRALNWMKSAHPKLYRAMLIERPDLIREAYARPLNGLSGMDGIFDDILGFATKAIPIYQQQKVFSAQMKQASAGVAPMPTPAGQPIRIVLPPATEQAVAKQTGFGIPRNVLIGLGAAATGLVLWMVLRRKKAR